METQPQSSPWENLDLDDSDISSSLPLLRRCSRPPSPPPEPPSRSLIPGPAAPIQAAMHRKDRFNTIEHSNHNRNIGKELSEVSTQEYIRRVKRDSYEEFSRDPWLFALDYLQHHHGMVDCTSLRDIKKCVNAQRIDQVVAIVKSCTPNGLGDLMVTLKDPTDTIGASVHRKVLTAEKFGNFVTVGSVLILMKAVAFSSSYASCYLNITSKNLVTVISENCKVYNCPEANGGTTQVISRNSETPERTTATVSRPAERNFEDVQQSYNLKRKAGIENLLGKENSTQANRLFSSRQIENATNKLPEERVHIDLADGRLGCYSMRQEDQCRLTQPGTRTVEGTARILEDLIPAENLSLATDLSSAPGISDSLGCEDTRQRNAANMKRLFRDTSTVSLTDKLKTVVHSHSGRSSTMHETVNDPDNSGAVDVQGHEDHRGISSAPSMMGNVVSADISETNGGQKRISVTDTMNQDDQDTGGANGYKKPRLGLISVTSVQKWTDEQLSILDMDEDRI